MTPRFSAVFFGDKAPPCRRVVTVVSLALAGAAAVLWSMPDPLTARAGALAVFCLTLWLGETVRPWVPTLLLLLLTPLFLGGLKPGFGWLPWAWFALGALGTLVQMRWTGGDKGRVVKANKKKGLPKEE